MVTKKPLVEISKMTSTEIALYIQEITQTEICADVKYCNDLLKQFLAK